MRDGVGVDVTWQLDGPLEVSVGDPAVGQPKTLSLASLARELPKDLHRAGVHHLGEEGGRGRNWRDSTNREGQ